tara:strand:- start:3464 stop:4621 length:1158 start_codon:yes stop_codon:yes gene_type:complete
MIPYGKHYIYKDDIDSVIEVLKSDFLTQGPKVPLFEKKISEYCRSKFAVAVNSATSALHISCLALGLTKGDKLWTSPNSFVASANCGLYCGAEVDFVDIDPLTYNLCPIKLEKKLEKAKKKNNLPKIVIPVHFAGQSCDMKKIFFLSKKYGFKIIEDASHAIGGKYHNKNVGGCHYSDITVFSFHPVKIITTSEGGAATTNNKEIYKKLNLLRTHGITRDSKLMKKKNEGDWYYQQIDLGFNYRMNDIQAALGISQMNHLDEFVMKRNKLKKRYDTLLEKLPILLPHTLIDAKSTFHLYPIQIDRNKSSFSRLKLFKELRKKKIGVNIHYIPIHTQPYFLNMGFRKGDYPVAETFYQNSITLPLFPKMTIKEQDEVINSLKSILL